MGAARRSPPRPVVRALVGLMVVDATTWRGGFVSLFCALVRAEPRVLCRHCVWSRVGGRAELCFSILERVARRCPHPWLHIRMLDMICNVGSSIYMVTVLVYHPLTHPMTRAARPGRFQPSRGGGNSIGGRFPLAAGPVLAQGGVTVSRLIC